MENIASEVCDFSRINLYYARKMLPLWHQFRFNVQILTKLEIQYIARPLRRLQWDLVSKHLYDLVFPSIACLVTCMHIILFSHNLNFHFYYQALSEFIVSPPLLVFNYVVLQNFGLISMYICSLTLFIFKIVLRYVYTLRFVGPIFLA